VVRAEMVTYLFAGRNLYQMVVRMEATADAAETLSFRLTKALIP
jgi:hypothetical protein